MSIMPEIVNAYFKTVLRELIPEFLRDSITSFWNKVKRGADSDAHFELHQLATSP
jgi:hypothetical protein